jgi:hypothetical protein
MAKNLSKTQKNRTVNELLMSCPDEEITRMGSAWKAVAAGDKREAVHLLRNAASGGDTAWYHWCADMADDLSKGEVQS